MNVKLSDNFTPIDSIITCNAYEMALTALGALEEGIGEQLSVEMIASLDNFIKVMLFSENVYVYGYVAEAFPHHHYQIRKSPELAPMFANAGKKQNQYLIDNAAIKIEVSMYKKEQIEKVSEFLNVDDISKCPHFRIKTNFKDLKTEFTQEFMSFDAVFVEHILELYGARYFKPVFPGESFYIGARGGEGHSNYSISDLVPDKIRNSFRDRLNEINSIQKEFGGLTLPNLPPVFLLRLLSGCNEPEELTSALLELRKSDEFKNFRKQALLCHDLIESDQLEKRETANKIIKYLTDYNFNQKYDTKNGLTAFFRYIKSISKTIKGDFIAPLEEIISLSISLYDAVGERPYEALKTFSSKKLDSKILSSFMENKFSDSLHLAEMKTIAFLLGLPENSRQWQGINVDFHVEVSTPFLPEQPNSRYLLCESSNIQFTEVDIKVMHKEMFNLY